MTHEHESRPGVETEAAVSDSAGNLSAAPILRGATDGRQRRADLTELSRRRDFYVRVYSERRDGVVQVQVFADLRSAQAKVDRTRSRGLAARIELIRVVSVQPLDDEAVTR